MIAFRRPGLSAGKARWLNIRRLEMKQMSQMPKPATERDEVPVQPRLPSETELEMVSAAGGTAVGVIARQRA
jgi:hypothetical protein